MKTRILTLTALLLSLACLLISCGSTEWRDDLSAGQAAGLVSAAVSGSAGGRHTADEDFISESSFGAGRAVLFEKTDSRVILLSDRSDVNIDEIGVFHVASAADVNAVRDVLKDYIASQKLRMKSLLESYNPTEIPKLDNASVKVCGQYVMYTILSAADTEAAQTAFEQALKPVPAA